PLIMQQILQRLPQFIEIPTGPAMEFETRPLRGRPLRIQFKKRKRTGMHFSSALAVMFYLARRSYFNSINTLCWVLSGVPLYKMAIISQTPAINPGVFFV